MYKIGFDLANSGLEVLFMIKTNTIEDLRREAKSLEEKLQAINQLISLYSENRALVDEQAVVPIKRRGRKAQTAQG
jgi:hypothetical protein